MVAGEPSEQKPGRPERGIKIEAEKGNFSGDFRNLPPALPFLTGDAASQPRVEGDGQRKAAADRRRVAAHVFFLCLRRVVAETTLFATHIMLRAVAIIGTFVFVSYFAIGPQIIRSPPVAAGAVGFLLVSFIVRYIGIHGYSLVSEYTVSAWYPVANLLIMYFATVMTGGWDSPYCILVWSTVVPVVSTGSPRIMVNFVPVLVFLLLAYTSLYLFSDEVLGNPFPQYPQENPVLIRTLFHLISVLSAIHRLRAMRVVTRDAIVKEMTANDTKTGLIAVVTHELRTPLSSILGWLEILQEKPLEPEVKQITDIMLAAAKNLHMIINDILDFSKFERESMEFEHLAFDLPSFLTDIVASSQVLAKPGVTLNLQSDLPPRCLVFGDAFRLRQAFSNFISNAAKFTEKGEIRVVANLLEEKAATKKRRVEFKVSDTGIGMSQDQISRLFQPFSQADTSTSRRFGGTGLGLCITKQILEGLGGRILVQSEFGKGSCFSWSLEFDAASEVDVLAGTPHVVLSPRKSPRAQMSILLADDNSFNQKLLIRALVSFNCSPVVVSNGKDALDEAAKTKFDLILLDVRMPIMDGITAAQEIRKRGILTPIVGFTGNSDTETRTEALAAGMNELLVKPVPLSDLHATVDRYRRANQRRSTL